MKENFYPDENIVISHYTLGELENIKSNHKDETMRYNARRILHILDKTADVIKVYWDVSPEIKEVIEIAGPVDGKILCDAISFKAYNENTVFYTNDLAFKQIAKHFFNGDVYEVQPIVDTYCGYLDVEASDEDLAYFYANPNENVYNLLTNEYINLYQDGECVDSQLWTGTSHIKVPFKTCSSLMFGEVKPYKNDVHQKLAFDSLYRNKLTLLRGPSGSGKSYIGLAFLMSLLDKGKIDRIVIFCNPAPAKDATEIGLRPGDTTTKLLDTQVGNILISKMGGRREYVEQLILDGKLMLLAFADIRGTDLTGMKAGVYITEAQNLNINLMKIALQRVGEDSIVIVDGDDLAQVDKIAYDGNNNGVRRMSKIFRGNPFYGEITLKTIHRSEIAKLADNM